MFVTVFYAIYNVKTGFITFCNGGHNSPHVLRADGTTVELPKAKNMVIGAFDGVEYKEETMQLERGETLVMFTDGVTEAVNSADEEFGTERLDAILCTMADKNCQQMVEAIKAGLSEFVGDAEQSDDITMLLLKRK